MAPIQRLRDSTNRTVRRALLRARRLVDRRIERLEERKRDLEAGAAGEGRAERATVPRQTRRRRPRQETGATTAQEV